MKLFLIRIARVHIIVDVRYVNGSPLPHADYGPYGHQCVCVRVRERCTVYTHYERPQLQSVIRIRFEF